MAPFGGKVGQLEECRLIGNTEVNGKYAYTSVFFIGVDSWGGAVTEVAVNLACTSVVEESVCLVGSTEIPK
jgi:hypothetical protein